MFQPSQERLSGYVYRRVAPPHFKVKRNWVAPDAFLTAPATRGLSVFRADMAAPRQVLQECIEDRRKRLVDADEAEQQKAAVWLAKNPDIETLVQKEYRVVAISIAALQAIGFKKIWRNRKPTDT